MDYSEELAVAHRAAIEAGEIMDDRVGVDFRSAVDTAEKSATNDLVTAVDRACQEQIVETIVASYPEDAIVSEEDERASATGTGREWIVDPIDGTSNFATGFPYFCVSIALRVDGEERVGVIHSPEAALDRTWYAVAGEGAFRSHDTTLDGEPISVSGHDSLEGATVHARMSERSATRRARDFGVVTALMERGAKLRRTASTALNLCHVAEGSADGYVVLSSNAWDYAAGSLIVSEAGGTVRLQSASAMDMEVVASSGTIQSDLEVIVTSVTGR
ncbi:MAG: inositol monophosphatase family protein [archaeon]